MIAMCLVSIGGVLFMMWFFPALDRQTKRDNRDLMRRFSERMQRKGGRRE